MTNTIKLKAQEEAKRFKLVDQGQDTERIILDTQEECLAKDILFSLQDEYDMEDTYPLVNEALDFIANAQGETVEEIEEEAYDCEYPSVYHSDRLKWLSGHLGRMQDVDEVLAEMHIKSISDAIAYAMQRRFERAVSVALDYLTNDNQ